MAITTAGGFLLMKNNKTERAEKRKENAALDQAVVTYRNTVGKNMMREGEKGDDEILLDLRESSLYQECSNKALLNPAIYDYAEEVVSLFDRHYHLTIHWLFAEDISPEEREQVKAIFRTHYANQHRHLKQKLQKEFLLALFFIFIGFLFLSFHLPFIQANGDSIYGEILDIFGWVLIWEAGSILFVNSLDNQADLTRDLFFFHAKFDEKGLSPEIPSEVPGDKTK